MGGGEIDRKKKSDVIIPELGAAKYWHVDPKARQFDPMSDERSNQEQLRIWGAQTPQPLDGTTAVLEALSRIGVSDAKQPSF